MLKVGLIGCGGMGARHAKSWRAMSDAVKLVAIADIDENNTKCKEEAEISGAKLYRSGEELLENEELDIVDVCIPTYLHTKYAVMAMEKGINVFVEKPVCLNEEEAKLLLDTEKRTGVKVQVGHVIRFWDEYAWLKDVISKKTYGEMVSATFQRLSPKPNWGWENWFNIPEKSGTAGLDLHIHDVDFVRYIMGGDPDEVFSRATRDNDGILDHIFSTFTYGDVAISVESGWDFPSHFPFDMNFRVMFRNASVVYAKDQLTVYTSNGEKIIPEIYKHYDKFEKDETNISKFSAYYNEMRYFVDKILANERIEIAPLSEAIESARLIWKEIKAVGGRVK